MTDDTVFPLEGGCDCGEVRYRLTTRPLIVHCCHCRWCQRESGTAFALKRTGRVSDPGGLNHRAAGCLRAKDDQTRYLHQFAQLEIITVRLKASTAG
jgi:hypothetical protein